MSTTDQARAELERIRVQEQIDAARAHRKEQRAADRRKRREERRARNRETARRVALPAKDLGPQLIVNAAAVYGQIEWAMSEVAPDTWVLPGQLALGALIAGAAESIAITVGWYAHDAYLAGATATAARLRRGSYLIAGIIGAVNYSHFAGPGLAPTPLAVVLAVFSIMSPILWGLYSRRAKRIHLRAEGAADCLGATFSAERFRAFPIRTIGARRWSIEHNVVDPIEAWDGYNAGRIGRPARGRIEAAWRALTATPNPSPIEGRSDRVDSIESGSGSIGSDPAASGPVVDRIESAPPVDSPAPDLAAVGAGANGHRPQSAGAQTPVVAAGAHAPRQATAKLPKPEQVAEGYRRAQAAIKRGDLDPQPSNEATRKAINMAPKTATAVAGHLRDGTTPEGL